MSFQNYAKYFTQHKTLCFAPLFRCRAVCSALCNAVAQSLVHSHTHACVGETMLKHPDIWLLDPLYEHSPTSEFSTQRLLLLNLVYLYNRVMSDCKHSLTLTMFSYIHHFHLLVGLYCDGPA